MLKEEKISWLLGGIGVVSLVAVVLLVILTGGKTKDESKAETFSKNDSRRPKAVLSVKELEWGTMKVNETKESEVELKNEGESPLELTRMSTSCGCTAVKAIFPDGKQTREYSMHKSSEKVVIQPGSKVALKVIYRPFTMPVEGPVTREVFLETNDPNNKNLVITAKVVVNK